MAVEQGIDVILRYQVARDTVSHMYLHTGTHLFLYRTGILYNSPDQIGYNAQKQYELDDYLHLFSVSI